jgi:long-chain acyl-CoA synthetase
VTGTELPKGRDTPETDTPWRLGAIIRPAGQVEPRGRAETGPAHGTDAGVDAKSGAPRPGHTVPDSATVQEPVGETLPDRVAAAAAATPDRPALSWQDTALTWADLEDRVARAAGGLRALGLVGDAHPARVAIALANTPDFAVALFAVMRAGLVAVPVNPGYTPREMTHVLGDSGAVLLITDGESPTAVDVVAPDALTGPPVAGGGVRREDLAVLLYTSGTEGKPKGAMLTHGALMANHEQVGRIEPAVVGPDDTLLLALPLFHAYGLNSGLGAVVYHGARGVLVDQFDPAGSLALIAGHRVTAVVGVPSMYVAWSSRPELRTAMASVRMAVCGAAPLEAATAARFAGAGGPAVAVGYGLTETAPVVTSTLVGPSAKPGSIGRPVPGVELKLVDADGTTVSDVDDDESGSDPGEIVVRGANLFLGYWPDARGGPDADGWWATGDIAYSDADGDLYLVDRRGELIIVNGFNVYPREVEIVLEAVPGVAEAAVLGVPHPYTGQTVKAFVVRAPGAEVTVDDVRRHAERNLARFKCPTVVEFVDELPHSAIGKVRKTLLRSES